VVGDLPEEVTIHSGPAGRPDSYVGRTAAVVALPAVQALLVGAFAVLPRIDPLGENAEEFGHAYDVFALSTVGFVVYSHVVVLLWNAGYTFAVSWATLTEYPSDTAGAGHERYRGPRFVVFEFVSFWAVSPFEKHRPGVQPQVSVDKYRSHSQPLHRPSCGCVLFEKTPPTA
jgi:hypothetical protein